MTMDDGNSVTTKLLTLLNVSATKIGKRKRAGDDFVPAEKLNKRKSISFAEPNQLKATSEKENTVLVESQDEPTATTAEDNEAEETADLEVEGSFDRKRPWTFTTDNN
jgi:U3 small nucleolar RNA-associated protein 25